MTVEALVNSRLILYYVLLLLSLVFSFLSNLKKKDRINQAGLAKYYSNMSIIFLVLFILNYAVSDTLQNIQPGASNNLGYLLFIYLRYPFCSSSATITSLYLYP